MADELVRVVRVRVVEVRAFWWWTGAEDACWCLVQGVGGQVG